MIADGPTGAAAIAAAGPMPSVPAGSLRAGASGGSAAAVRHVAERIASEARSAEAPRP